MLELTMFYKNVNGTKAVSICFDEVGNTDTPRRQLSLTEKTKMTGMKRKGELVSRRGKDLISLGISSREWAKI